MGTMETRVRTETARARAAGGKSNPWARASRLAERPRTMSEKRSTVPLKERVR
jgi:hypothetical protein